MGSYPAPGPDEDRDATGAAAPDGPTPGRNGSSRAGTTAAGRRTPMSPLTLVGLVLLLAGLSLLGWAGWQFLGTNITSRHAAQQTTTELREQWQATPASPSAAASGKPGASIAPAAGQTPSAAPQPDQAMALLRIPALGEQDWPVLVGTSDDALGRGIGWYSQTAQPGAVGNFALAGHRITHGEPFRRLLELERGAQVIVETRDSVYTYELDNAPSELTVADTAGWVLDPVPGKPAQQPTRALITLTTCQDLFHSPDRSVAFGHLVSKTDK